MTRFDAFRAVVVTLLLCACGAEPQTFDPLGSLSYQHATLCVGSADQEMAEESAAVWEDATAGKVSLSVRIVADVSVDDFACDAFVADAHTPGAYVGMTIPGRIALDPARGRHANVLTHEIGHLLFGDAWTHENPSDPAHSVAPVSIMHAEASISDDVLIAPSSDDIARLP